MHALILVCLVAAATALAPLHIKNNRVPGKYIVSIKADASLDSVAFNLNTVCARVTKRFSAFNMLAVDMDSTILEKVRALDDVLYIEEDAVIHAQAAPWGLDRTDQRRLPLNGWYFPYGNGTGVNIYVIDTGIFPEHNDFNGRAMVAFDALGNNEGIDCNGHGTHCSGTASGRIWGIASDSNVFGVRVLSCLGSGTLASILSGMNWVTTNRELPAVASMSLGGEPSNVLDDAVAALHNSSVVVSVAAGNNGGNACAYSPGRAPEAITVGATDSSDDRASFSNYGSCLDIYAPGVSITSAWIGENGDKNNVNTISGTSMACPHVSGAAALYLQANPSMTPGAVWAQMSADSTPGVVNDAGFRSPNKLLYVPRASNEITY